MEQVDLHAIWLALARDSGPSHRLRLAPLPITTDFGTAHLGRDGAARAHLLIPIAPDTAVRTDEQSEVVRITQTSLPIDGDQQHFIDIYCNDPSLEDVFQRLAEEMIQRLEANPRSAAVICQDVLSRWRHLLRSRREGMTLDEITGLFGELWLLDKIVTHDTAKRIDVWKGPLGARHDFVTRNSSIEVKATRKLEGRVIGINGIRQLEADDDRELFLQFIRVEPNSNGSTIDDHIFTLKNNGVDSAQLDRLIASAGWEPGTSTEKMTVTEADLYRVTEGFPRIVPTSFLGAELPLGVTRLRYSITLEAGTAEPLHHDECDAVYRRFALEPR